MMFEKAIDGCGARTIHRFLNDNRYTNIAFGYSARSKKRWNLRYVETILKDRKTFGEMQPASRALKGRTSAGEPIKNYFPAVISEETFLAAQDAIRGRQTQHGPAGHEVANLFQGLLVDFNFEPFILQSGSKQDKRRGIRRRYTANGKSWPACQFEKCFFQSLLQIPLEKSRPSTKLSSLKDLSTELEQLERRIAFLTKRLATARDAPEALRLVNELDGKRNKVSEQIEAMKSQRRASKCTVLPS